MKKVFLAAALAVTTAAGANAQDTVHATHPHTVANHSVSTEYLGLHYAYEHPVGRAGTVIGRAGTSVFMALSKGAMHAWHYVGVKPSVEVEPRWHYGLDRRAANGVSTAKNSGSFLSLRINTYLPYDYVNNTGGKMAPECVTFIAPTWGFRRVWSDRWMFEFHTGVFVSWNHTVKYLSAGIDLNIRFGMVF